MVNVLADITPDEKEQVERLKEMLGVTQQEVTSLGIAFAIREGNIEDFKTYVIEHTQEPEIDEMGDDWEGTMDLNEILEQDDELMEEDEADEMTMNDLENEIDALGTDDW